MPRPPSSPASPSGPDGPEVFGAVVDDQTRCVHWHSESDVVAIQFACCRRFYPCHACHEADADHAAATWPRSRHDELAVLCGVCRHLLSIEDYLDSNDTCPTCGAGFNPGCRLHRLLYFAPEPPGETVRWPGP